MVKKIIFLCLFVFITVGAYIGYSIWFQKPLEGEVDVVIKNNTNQSIEGLYVTYDFIEKDIKVPALKENESKRIQSVTKENFSDNTLTLYYQDKKGKRIKEIIYGYFEKPYTAKSTVTIHSIDENGKLNITTKEEPYLYDYNKK